VAVGPQNSSDGLVDPSTAAAAVYQNKCCHDTLS
jgi:hypothetical protein